MSKTCVQCKKTKEASEFYKTAIRCKTCISANNKAKWAALSIEERREINAKKDKRYFYGDRYKGRYKGQYSKERHYRSKYGLTLEDVRRMSAEQNHQCAICGESRILCVDHDHETGDVRALLCSRCNRLLGIVGDCKVYLQRCISYLEKHAGKT